MSLAMEELLLLAAALLLVAVGVVGTSSEGGEGAGGLEFQFACKMEPYVTQNPKYVVAPFLFFYPTVP